MSEKINILNKAAQPVLSMRANTSVENLPKIIGNIYSKIIEYLDQVGQEPADVPFVAYYNLDMDNLDVEIGFPVNESVEGKGEIKKSHIPQGNYIEMTYKGPYSEMAYPYEEMSKWMEEKGYKSKNIYYEYYYNSPQEVSPNELITKISMAVD